MKKFILLLTALTAATALSAHAQITVTTNTSTSAWNAREADPLTAVFTANSTAGGAGGVTSDSSLIQTFTLGSAISAESFHIRFQQGGNLTLAIYQVANANEANPLTLGSFVWSEIATLPSVGSSTTFANLTLDTPVALAAGAYAFVIDTSLATAFEWRRTSNSGLTGDPLAYPGNTYAGGRAYATGTVNGVNANFNNGSSEFSFAVVAIPEPSSFALLAGAMLLGFGALLRRRK
jgi:hypothetical protein